MGLSTKTRKTKKIVPAKSPALIHGAYVREVKTGMTRQVDSCTSGKISFIDRPFRANLSEVKGLILSRSTIERLTNGKDKYIVDCNTAYLPGSEYELRMNLPAQGWDINAFGRNIRTIRYIHELQLWHSGACDETLRMYDRITNYDKR